MNDEPRGKHEHGHAAHDAGVAAVRPDDGPYVKATAEPAGGRGRPRAGADGAHATLVGRHIDNYKLLQLIGEGGFGAVYMAEQREPVRRKVALKLIKLGMDTNQVIARFEAERQALAMMDHPNIAKVLDAGATETGRPYFVMELVRGVAITTYCDTENLTTKQRLQLFCDVCRAVQHAHQKGIIHRDIKPGNVLVTLHDGKPVPKVIDFGIAKATSAELTQRTLFTEFRQFIGTPEYMSPEQAEMSGLDIDTRTDIYSLGVLLYELLTGTTPFDGQHLRSVALDEIQRIIREQEPPRPSTRVSSLSDSEPVRGDRRRPHRGGAASSGTSIQVIARHRRTDPRHLTRELRGDLDWIIMKTLEKDRTRRYDTASALAEDIERHLNEQPVRAGPPGAGYRLRKFYRRHRGRVAAAAALALAVVLGLVGTSLGMVQARAAAREAEAQRARAEEAQTATEQAMAQTHSAMADAKEQAAVAEAVSDFLNDDLLAAVAPDEVGRDVTVLQMLDRAAREIETRFAERPAVLATLHHTIGKSYTALGRYDEAARHVERSVQIRRRAIGEERRETMTAQSSLAALHLYRGRYADAEAIYAGLLKRAREHLGADDPVTLGVANNLAVAYMGQSKRADALQLLSETLEAAERALGRDHPYTIKTLGSLANATMGAGRIDEAQAQFEDVLARQERSLGKDHVNVLTTRSNLGMIYRDRGQLSEAERTLREVLEARRRLLGDEHAETLGSMTNLAMIHTAMERDQEAETLLREAVEVGARMVGEEHLHTLIAVGQLAGVTERLGRASEAESLFRRALDGLERSMGMSHEQTLSARADLIAFYRRAGREPDIERIVGEHVRALKRAAERDDATADTLNTAAYELVSIEPASLRDARAAVAFAERACELTQHRMPYYLDTLACALAAAGEPVRAIEVQRRALAQTPDEDPGRSEMLAHLRQFEAALNESAGATRPTSKPSDSRPLPVPMP